MYFLQYPNDPPHYLHALRSGCLRLSLYCLGNCTLAQQQEESRCLDRGARLRGSNASSAHERGTHLSLSLVPSKIGILIIISNS